MTAQIQFTEVEEPELLGTLGTFSEKASSSISPFNYGKDSAGPERGHCTLAALEICDAEGKILPDKQAAVNTLATADAFTRIYLTTPPESYRIYCLLCSGRNDSGITNDNGIRLISSSGHERCHAGTDPADHRVFRVP